MIASAITAVIFLVGRGRFANHVRPDNVNVVNFEALGFVLSDFISFTFCKNRNTMLRFGGSAHLDYPQILLKRIAELKRVAACQAADVSGRRS